MEAQNLVPSVEEFEDVMLACRYGLLDEVRDFVGRYGNSVVGHVDENGNSCLHMAAANGHEDVTEYLLGRCQNDAWIARANAPPASNTPLHWAALNHHLPILKLLCARLTTEQICIRNGNGLSAMSLAVQSSGMRPPDSVPADQEPNQDHIPNHEQCVNYLVEMMKLGDQEETGSTLEKRDSVDDARPEADLQEKLQPLCLR